MGEVDLGCGGVWIGGGVSLFDGVRWSDFGLHIGCFGVNSTFPFGGLLCIADVDRMVSKRTGHGLTVDRGWITSTRHE